MITFYIGLSDLTSVHHFLPVNPGKFGYKLAKIGPSGGRVKMSYENGGLCVKPSCVTPGPGVG